MCFSPSPAILGGCLERGAQLSPAFTPATEDAVRARGAIPQAAGSGIAEGQLRRGCMCMHMYIHHIGDKDKGT